MTIPLWLRREVVRRAGNRCEYCGLSQTGQEATFHIDHIIPLAESGSTESNNLALACVSCSLRKGARRHGIDSLTGRKATLYHPRLEQWTEHFHWEGCKVRGITPRGRATVHLVKMNRTLALAIRAEEKLHGRHPPPYKESN